jgi:pimeloyl-ACP methyl ester carboxylesterase
VALIDARTVTVSRARIGAGDTDGVPRRRIILLPGAFQEPSQFQQHGFDQTLQECTGVTELLAAAPELSHLNDRRWLSALYEEQIVPARALGMEVWLGGVSLGGFMALRLAAQYPDALDGLCLLAPYLGSRIIASELADHADLQQWEAHTADRILDEDDDERRIWRYVARLERSMHHTEIFLGFGADDRFADTQRLLARALPATAAVTHVMAGGHDWPVWQTLWQAFVRHLPADVSFRT